MSDSSRSFRQRQGKTVRWLCSGVVLLTTLLAGSHLAGGNSPAFHFHPLSPPNAIAPTSDSSTAADLDPRATELAQRLRQHLDSLQTTTQHQTTARLTLKQSSALSQLRARNQDNGDVSVWLHPTAGTPRQIKGEVLQHAQYSSILGTEAHEATARTFLQTNRGLLRLDDPQAELELTRQQTDALGHTHLRFD